MIRMLFAVFLPMAALVGLSLRLSRDAEPRVPAEPAAAEVRTLDLREAVSSALAGARRDAERTARELRDGAATAAAEVAAAEQGPLARNAPTPAPEASLPTEEEVVPARSAPFHETPLPAGGDADSGGEEAPAAEPAAATWVAAASVDQDAWAALIRRMLSVYRQTGDGE